MPDNKFHQMKYIQISSIIVKNNNIRLESNKTADEELLTSINANGLIQPIGVTPIKNDTYQLVCGHRRLDAVKKLGWTEIPAVIFDSENCKSITIVENLQRKELSNIELALGVMMLVDETTSSYDEIGLMIGKKHKSWVSRVYKFAKCYQEKNKTVSFTKLPLSTYLELVNSPELLVKAEDENWTQLRAREEASTTKKCKEIPKSNLVNQQNNSSLKSSDSLLPAYYKQSQLVAYNPIEFKDNGFTINAFYFDKHQAFDVEAVVEKLFELQNNLDFAIKIIREHENGNSSIPDDLKEEFHDVL